MTTLAHTQVAIELSINIYQHKDNAFNFAVLPLFSLTPVIILLWATQRYIVARFAHLAARLVFTFDRVIDWLALPITLSKTMSKTLSKTYLDTFLMRYGLLWEIKGV